MSQNINKEDTLKKNCDIIASAIESMITAKAYENHQDFNVKKRAKKIRKEAHDRIRDILVELIKSASDPSFVMKDIKVTDDNEFKFHKF